MKSHHGLASCVMLLINHGGKKAIDVVFTYICHLNNIMPDSIFYDSIEWGINCFFKGDNHCFPQRKRIGFSLII